MIGAPLMRAVMPIKNSAKQGVFEKALSILNLSQKEYQILDFGCGNGDFLGNLSQIVAQKSQLVGIDGMEKAIANAKSKYPIIEFICNKFIDQIPYSDASFDIVVTIDTLECIKDRKKLIDEFYRILKSHGKILAVHWDWDTQIYNVECKDIARKAVRVFSDWKQPWMEACDGQMGRKLWGLFEGSKKFSGYIDTYSLIETKYEQGMYGFDRIQELALVSSEGLMTKNEYLQFCQELFKSYANGQYLYTVTSFIYYGEKT